MAASASFVVLSNAAEGCDDELRTWYQEVHLPDARAIPGVVSAALREWRPVEGMPPSKHTFMAVYELDAEPGEVWAEFQRRIAEGVMAMTDAQDAGSMAFAVWAPCADSPV